jgi:hypothetical protein
MSGQTILPNGQLSCGRYIGQTLGAITVIGAATYLDRAGRERSGFLVEYTCCGKRTVHSRAQVSNQAAKPAKTCNACRPDTKPIEIRIRPVKPKPKAEADLPRRADGVMIPGTGPGCGWWPVIAWPMGPRWSGNGNNTFGGGARV